MADLTAPQCAGIGPGSCKLPHSCCSPEYCEMAIERAATLGEVLEVQRHDPRLPLMGPGGCVAAPHLRPLCTLHVCSINSLGFNPLDEEWTRKYSALRDKLKL